MRNLALFCLLLAVIYALGAHASTLTKKGSMPGGSNTHVQYNDGGTLGGDAGMTYNETTNALSLGDDSSALISLTGTTGVVRLMGGGSDVGDSGDLLVNNGFKLAAESDPTGTDGVFTFTGGNRWQISPTMLVVPQASAPASPAAGEIYVDSTPAPDELCFWDGAGWQGISSGTDANCS